MIVPREVLGLVQTVSTDETRPVLNGLLVSENDTTAKAVSCDGRICLEAVWRKDGSEYPIIPNTEVSGEPVKEAIIPTAALKAIGKAIPKKTALPILRDNFLLKMGRQKAGYQNGETRTAICLATTDLNSATVLPTLEIEGTFPRYESAFPESSTIKTRIKLSVVLFENLLAALKKAGMESFELGLIESGDKYLASLSVSAESCRLKITGAIMPMRA